MLVSSSFCSQQQDSNSKDRWVTTAIIINIYIISTMCYQHKKGKCSNKTHKILIIIVHINLVTVIVNLMKMRSSITKRNTLVKERNPYWILSSKLLSPPLLSAGNHIEDRWNTTLNRHQRHYHHQPYPTSRCSGHLSESYALLRCSTSWSSFWYCGCFLPSSSSTQRWHYHRYQRQLF